MKLQRKTGEQIDQRYNITYFQGVLAATLGLLFSPVKQLLKIVRLEPPRFSNNFNELQRYGRRTVFDSFLTWVGKHCKDKNLAIRFVMESTGVYHEQLAWYLFQNDLTVSVILPNKAKHYLKSIGNAGPPLDLYD